jgi:hypothetical protein
LHNFEVVSTLLPHAEGFDLLREENKPRREKYQRHWYAVIPGDKKQNENN